MSKTRAQIAAEIAANLPDNSSGAITPNLVRTTLSDIADAAPNLADDGTPATTAQLAAAEAAAAADATAKANAAQSAAIAASDPSGSAAAAQAAASADATSKANAAQATAISTASSDATSKANAAQSAAISASLSHVESANKAFVSLFYGDDETAAVGKRNQPFETIQAAYDAVAALPGNQRGQIVFLDSFDDLPTPGGSYDITFVGDWDPDIGLACEVGYARDPASVNITLEGPTRQTVEIFCTNVYVNIMPGASFAGADITLNNITGGRFAVNVSQENPASASTIKIFGARFLRLDYFAEDGKTPITTVQNVELLDYIAYILNTSGTVGAISIVDSWLSNQDVNISAAVASACGDLYVQGGGTSTQCVGGFTYDIGSANFSSAIRGFQFGTPTSTRSFKITGTGTGTHTFDLCSRLRIISSSGQNKIFVLNGCPSPIISSIHSTSQLVTDTKISIPFFSTALLTAGAPADIISIAVPYKRYLVLEFLIEAKSAAGTLAAGTLDLRTATAGGGSSAFAAATALTGLTAADTAQSIATATGTVFTAATLTVRQTVASANAGDVAGVLVIQPMA